MKSNVYDVTLYWHDGGSLFLGAVAASSAGAAQDDALHDAADWRLKRKK